MHKLMSIGPSDVALESAKIAVRIRTKKIGIIGIGSAHFATGDLIEIIEGCGSCCFEVVDAFDNLINVVSHAGIRAAEAGKRLADMYNRMMYMPMKNYQFHIHEFQSFPKKQWKRKDPPYIKRYRMDRLIGSHRGQKLCRLRGELNGLK